MKFKTITFSSALKQVTGTCTKGEFYSPYHGFHPESIRHLRLEPHFGSMEELTIMMAALRHRGIRVFSDTVPNHLGYESPELYKFPKFFHLKEDFQRAEGNEQRKFETRWYSGLPDLKHSHPSVRTLLDRMYNTLLAWGFEGFRFDAVNHCDRDWVKYVVQEGSCKGVPVFGEVFHGDPYVHVPYWEMGMATTNYPLYYKLQQLSRPRNQARIEEISSMLNLVHSLASSHGLLLNFLDNHDTKMFPTFCLETGMDRLHAIERTDMAYTLIYSLPGVPCVYAGAEALREGSEDSSRWSMDFSPEKQVLKERFAALNTLRENRAVGWGEYRQLYTGHGVLAFVRFLEGQLPVFVVLNAWDRQVELWDLPGQISIAPFTSEGELRELTGRSSNLTIHEGKLTGTLPARTTFVLSPAA